MPEPSTLPSLRFRPGDVVTLVASVKYLPALRHVEWHLSERGVLVFPVVALAESGLRFADTADAAARVADVCETHQRKIQRSNAVLMVDHDHAIGTGSRRALAFAEQAGVLVCWLSQEIARDPEFWQGLPR